MVTAGAKAVEESRPKVWRDKRLHAANYGVYGVRKMWHAMRRAWWGIGIGIGSGSD